MILDTKKLLAGSSEVRVTAADADGSCKQQVGPEVAECGVDCTVNFSHFQTSANVHLVCPEAKSSAYNYDH